jgi:acetyl-CoA hydrolase
MERARLIVEKCAHPDFREPLMRYVEMTRDGHTPQTLRNAFAMHQQFLKTGDMHNTVWAG